MGARTTLLQGNRSGEGWKRNFIDLEAGQIRIPAIHTKTLKARAKYQVVEIDSIPPLRSWLEYSIELDSFESPKSPIARITQPAVSRFVSEKILMKYPTAFFKEGESDFSWEKHYRNALRNSFFTYGNLILDRNVLAQAAENRFNSDSYVNHEIGPTAAKRYFAMRPPDLESLDVSKIRPHD